MSHNIVTQKFCETLYPQVINKIPESTKFFCTLKNVSRETFLAKKSEIWHKMFHVKHFLDF